MLTDSLGMVQLEQDYDDLLDKEIREAEVLLGLMKRFRLYPEQ